MTDVSLTQEDITRFKRQIILEEIGESGQRELKNARLLIVGLGGLGSPIALYLAAAGVGTIGIVDGDIVDISNLHRQPLYCTQDIGKKKCDIAVDKMKKVNSQIKIEAFYEEFSAINASKILENYDLVLDATDNFKAHYLINDACILANKPLIYGHVLRYEGQMSVILPHNGPCYRCLYPVAPPPEVSPPCIESGVLGVIPGIIGTLQALEALKIILNLGEVMSHRLLRFDGLKMNFREIHVHKDPACSVCGNKPTILSLEPSSQSSACVTTTTLTAVDLLHALASDNPPYLLDVRNPAEYESGHLDKAHLIPLSILPEHLHELDKTLEIVIYCHSGIRSAHALALLKAHGFTNAKHLKGGIVAMQDAGHPM